MKLFRSPEERRNRKINREVYIQADCAAESIVNRYIDGKSPPYRFDAGPTPEGLSRDDFSHRIGELTVRKLQVDFDDVVPVEYDEAASKTATDEFPAIRKEMPIPTTPDDVILVFSQRPQPPNLRLIA